MADEKKALIIDDDEDLVMITETYLCEVGDLDIVTANDGETGLAKALEEKPDIIILDVQMPGKNGFEVFQELKKDDSTRDIPVIMMTGVGQEVQVHFTAEEVGKMLGTAPDAYLEKPVEPDEFIATAKKLLGL